MAEAGFRRVGSLTYFLKRICNYHTQALDIAIDNCDAPTNCLTIACQAWHCVPCLFCLGKGAGDLSGCITVIAPAICRNGSLEAQIAKAKAGREEPIVDLLNCGVSAAGIRAQRDLMAKWACPQKASQRLEKIDSVPGGHGLESLEAPRYGKRRSSCRRTPKYSPKRSAKESDGRGACLNKSITIGLETVPQRLENIETPPGNGMAPDGSDPQYLVQGRAVETIGPTDAERRKGLRRRSHGLRAQGGPDPRKRQFLAPKRLKTKARGQT